MPREIVVKVNISASYIEELKGRLQRYGISHNELADQMAMDRGQMSRLMNKTKSGLPRMETIQRIETAVVELRAKKRKVKRRQTG